MILISEASLAAARKSCPQQLEALANDLLPISSPHHEARKQEFMNAVENNDDKRVNTMIKEALERYMNTNNLFSALGNFCQRMDLPSNVMELGETGILEYISEHSSEISKKLNEELNNVTK